VAAALVRKQADCRTNVVLGRDDAERCRRVYTTLSSPAQQTTCW